MLGRRAMPLRVAVSDVRRRLPPAPGQPCSPQQGLRGRAAGYVRPSWVTRSVISRVHLWTRVRVSPVAPGLPAMGEAVRAHRQP